MLVSTHVFAALAASFRRAAVLDSPCPAAVCTPRVPSPTVRWLGGLHNVMLAVLVVTAVITHTVPIDGRAGVQATITIADSLLARGQQVLEQPHGAALPMNTVTAAPVFVHVGARVRYRTYIPMARTAPRSPTLASIDLSKYPTEYIADNGYVYTGRRAQVLHHMREQFSARVTTYASHSECPTCSADLWTPDARGGVDNTALPSMNTMAEYVRTNRSALGIKYVIWNQRISMGGTWQEMEDRGSITANHKDHVHFTFIDSFQ